MGFFIGSAKLPLGPDFSPKSLGKIYSFLACTERKNAAHTPIYAKHLPRHSATLKIRI
jgi:hypothetical protein